MGRMTAGAPPAGQILHRLVGRTAHAATRRRGAVAVFASGAARGSPGNPRRFKPPMRQVLCHATRTSFETERIVAAAPRSPHEIAAVEFHEHESNASLGAFVGGTLSSREGREVPAPRYCPQPPRARSGGSPGARTWCGSSPRVWTRTLSTRTACRARWSRRRRRARCARSRGWKTRGSSSPGSGVEYDHVDPRELRASLETARCRAVPGRADQRHDRVRGGRGAGPRRGRNRRPASRSRATPDAASGSSRPPREKPGTRRTRRGRRLPRRYVVARATPATWACFWTT